MKLFSYQENVLESCKKDPSHSQLISMPTGTGKTITFLHLAKLYSKKTLIIVHREELLNQTFNKAKICGFDEKEISIINAERKEKLTLLNIAMVQSLNRNLEKYASDDIEMIIVDEAHHATAPSYLNIFRHFKIFEEKKLLFGFTATPLRGDKEHLGNIFLSHSFKMTLSEATRLGYIVPVHGMRIEIDKSLKDIDTQQGDYDISELDKVMNCDTINNLIAERCINLKKTPSIIFCTSVNHAQEIAAKLREKKRKAISVSYKTCKRTLERIFKFLNQGRIEFITNAVKLSEGFDHPPIQSIIIARPTRSPVLYKQMIGRGLRNNANKYDCFVLEFTSNDPKMMKWEDIDENATFQSSSEKEKKSQEEARKHYKSLFKNPNIEILDVRLSHFEFYECKMRRICKYKNYYFVPFEEGFVFYELKRSNEKKDKIGANYFHLFATMLFWEDKMNACYVWNEGNICMTSEAAQPIENIPNGIKHYSKVNNLGRWYPSDLEPITKRQKIQLDKLGIKSIKSISARKAEMEIEEISIKKFIDKYLSKHLFSGIMKI